MSNSPPKYSATACAKTSPKPVPAALSRVEFVVQQRLAHDALVLERGKARADLRSLMERRFAVGERLFALKTHAVNAGFSTEGAARWKK